VVSGWNFGVVWETIAAARPEEPALIHGDAVRSWGEFDSRSEALARYLVSRGLRPGASVAQYLFNSPAYLESVFACFKAALTPVNTNVRYRSDELRRLWSNAEAEVVVFDRSLSDQVEDAREGSPQVKAWIAVDGARTPERGSTPWAVDLDDAIREGRRLTRLPGDRSGDDLVLLYTGGTTGLPKGVMWRQDDLYNAISSTLFHDPVMPALDAVRRRVLGATAPTRLTPASPLGHSLAFTMALGALCEGGTVVLGTEPSFRAGPLIETMSRKRVTKLVIVGDAFARPINDRLDDAAADPVDLTALTAIVSGGAQWSPVQKRRTIARLPHVTLIDLFGSSEAFGAAHSTTSADAPSPRFRVGRHARVIDENGRDVAPGSGSAGLLAIGGFQPLGYYKDPESTARLFRTIDGRRYAVPGDYARVEPDGTLTILGRGTSVINTGGEKVFPPEIEEAIKQFPGVTDAVVTGVEDERYGQRVVAVLSVNSAQEDFPVASLDAYLRERLADYKRPREYHFCVAVPRNSIGKIDYAALSHVVRKRGVSH
jgi:acyl-CoA synthetase (AMP-forming)/AMP-acid ligase II